MFIMSSPEGTLSTTGTTQTWPSVDAAVNYLNQCAQIQTNSIVVGALPFFSDQAPALSTPAHWSFDRTLSPRPPSSPPVVDSLTESPTSSEHYDRVTQAIQTIRDPENTLEKVVLSRGLTASLQRPLDIKELYSLYFHSSHSPYVHALDLDGTHCTTGIMAGSSPELLIEKRGAEIRSFPLAGTMPRSSDPDQDLANAQTLQASTKDTSEHAFVTTEIKRILQLLCTHLDVPTTPSLTNTSHTWHLGTPITGVLKDPEISVLTLAYMLHPTPALGGYPRADALDYLRIHEPDRGFYGGTFGYATADGDGQWRVTIRSALQYSTELTARAGGGIVSASNPEQEVEETTAKLGPFLTMLGLPTF